MSFQKVKEDFVCGHCGKTVFGNGFTNHCPSCLWSKHVDIEPGDRAGTCGALMEPTSIEDSEPYTIVHTCTRCREVRRVKSSSDDNAKALIEVAERRANDISGYSKKTLK